MNESRNLYSSTLAGEFGLPKDLHSQLPLLLRRRSAFFDVPISLAAIAALLNKCPLLGVALLVVAALIANASFWMAKYWLIKKKKWIRGTWYAEELPGIQRARSAFFLLLVLAGCGSYSVLVTKILTPFLTVPAMLAWALIVPAYFYVSIRQGYVGSTRNVDYRSESPTKFWFGLLLYSGIIGLFAVAAIFLIFRSANAI